MNTATTIESNPVDLLLNSGDWFPVMSVQDGDSRAFSEVWISELPERPLDDAVDHSGAMCHRVGLEETLRWEHMDGSLAGYTGKIANSGTEIDFFMIDDDDGNLYIHKHSYRNRSTSV